MTEQPTNQPPIDRSPTELFGFRTVAPGAKKPLVRNVFDSVASRYDVMNDLMSGGIHRLWKHAMVERLNPRPGQHLLDVAGGTGDIAFRIASAAAARGGPARVTVCDINRTMLGVARDRAIDRGMVAGEAPDWVCGDAESLPFPDRSVDGYTIAFGLRNVTDIDRALIEARRVLKPGGRFLCLEFTPDVSSLLKAPYDFYSFTVLPALGRAVAGDADSYRYLAESIRRFPSRTDLVGRMTAAGFERVQDIGLTGGIAALHSAWRL